MTGTTPEIRTLQSQQEQLAHCLALLRDARRLVRIHSPDFTPWLYGHPEVVELCKEFLLSHERNRLQILLHDSRRILAEGHRMLPLVERLASRAHIRIANPDHELFPDYWLSVDDHGMLLQTASEASQARAVRNSPLHVRRYHEQFDSMWEVARPDINLRRMPL